MNRLSNHLSTRTRTRTRIFIAVGALVLAASAGAQTVSAAQQRYQAELAVCNAGNLAAPARDACVRDAGLALDRARGGPPVDVPRQTSDGRSTVVAPAGAPPPETDSDTRTSRDGRATIVLPAGRFGTP